LAALFGCFVMGLSFTVCITVRCRQTRRRECAPAELEGHDDSPTSRTSMRTEATREESAEQEVEVASDWALPLSSDPRGEVQQQACVVPVSWTPSASVQSGFATSLPTNSGCTFSRAVMPPMNSGFLPIPQTQLFFNPEVISPRSGYRQ
jgi:hypothetical protein